MGTLRTVSNRAKALGIVLVVIVGLLNFHVPHFLIEPPTSIGDGSYLLELVVLTNLLGALAAAAGIYRNGRWGWFLGMVIAGTSFTLYLAQETVGLPGLPKVWLEPSGTFLNAAVLTAPLAIAGGEALHMAGDYEAAVNKIKGLTSASPADIVMWSPA